MFFYLDYRELVKTLHERGVVVYLVSGGFRSLIEPVAEQLHISPSNLYANRLKFYFNGEYVIFILRFLYSGFPNQK